MNATTAAGIGIMIRGARTNRGWTQEHLAQQVGVSARWLQEMGRGKDTASLGLVLRTLTALDIAVTLVGNSAASTDTPPLTDYPDIDAIIAQRLKP